MAAKDYHMPDEASASRPGPFYGAYDPTSHAAPLPSDAGSGSASTASYVSHAARLEVPTSDEGGTSTNTHVGASGSATVSSGLGWGNSFDSVLDSRQELNAGHGQHTPSRAHAGFGLAQDTQYHSTSPADVSPITSNDDIPLRHHDYNAARLGSATSGPAGPAGTGMMSSTDHVYDVPVGSGGGSGMRRRGTNPERSRKGLLHYGELGMLGSNKRRVPVMVYLFSLVQVAVFIGELVKAAQLTGSPIQTQPSFNPLIGPSSNVLITMGSRYVICMHKVDNVNTVEDLAWPCPNVTTSDMNSDQYKCSLQEVCGFGGSGVPAISSGIPPNQWWRWITPIFMHTGIIHIGFNLLLQLTLGKEIERAIGSVRFFLVYMSAGIFGFIMGGNYAAVGVSSTGASGALFGIIALTLLDLLYSWKERLHPVRELMFIIIEMLISFVLGLLPGLDNFSHIGGFLMGLCLGVCILHSPNALRKKIGSDHFGSSYATVNRTGGISSAAFPPFLRNPVGFFKGRKGLWWAWWLVRAGFLVTIIVVFIVLLNNFYTNTNNCSWCKYLSCLPVNGWCDIGNPNIQNTTTPTKRAVDAIVHVAGLY